MTRATVLDAIIHRLEMVTVHGVEYWQVPDRQTAKVRQPPSVHLLPGFDEYMLGYTDRSIQLGERNATTARPSRRMGCSRRRS